MPPRSLPEAGSVMPIEAMTSPEAIFGSQACFYSDSTVLAAQGAGCPSYEHALSQLPYAVLGAGISAIGFLVIA